MWFNTVNCKCCKWKSYKSYHICICQWLESQRQKLLCQFGIYSTSACISNCSDTFLAGLQKWWLWGGLSTGCPKKNGDSERFWVFDLGGVFLGVKNNSKNFGNKKNIRLFSKILSIKWTLFIRKMQTFWCFYEKWPCKKWKTFFKCHKSQYFCICTCKYKIFWLYKWFLPFWN